MSEKNIEELIESICSGSLEERRNAAEELGKTGAPAIPALVSVLESRDNDSRWYASRALVMIGPSCTDALLESVRKEESHDLRRYVAGIFVSLGEDAVDLLVGLLGDPDPNVRGMASMALRKIGAPAVPLLYEVVATAASEDIRRRAAFLTLINMDCVDQEHLSDLMKS